MIVVNERRVAIIDVAPNQKLDKPLRTNEMEAMIDPRAEWRQIFSDAWRFQRDFFYDPNMHGVDWDTMREQYGRLIEDAVTRWDVNYVLGELIAELNSSHTYRGGGDQETAPQRPVGTLGVDWSVQNGFYRIEKIVRGAPWDADVRSPLAEPGVKVNEGDYVLAVNGVPFDTSKDPWAAFEGLAGRTVALTVNDRASMDGAREVLVETLRANQETRLRHLAWIESNRKRVEEATDGRVGYVYVRSTGIDGQNELVRQFSAQFDKAGMIVDERFNSGGQIPDRFVELLNRPPLAFWAVRTGKDWQWPPVSHFGPKVMLINGWSGSGGDAFPYYFKEAGVGPLIGSRTWGGLIGLSGTPPLVDGGVSLVPTFRMYSTDGEWFPEGHGVEPDIDVPEDPTALARGSDPQLERAIEEVMSLIRQNPPVTADRPDYEDRTAGAARRAATNEN
jgi:tricorn protease